ncbi:hypothetical protein J2TS4_46780 [Paenibacillus sp. J2TS4]|nr:hypothetical protein J2TS4_46780 [Paenibacillus sp. J2TS4]
MLFYDLNTWQISGSDADQASACPDLRVLLDQIVGEVAQINTSGIRTDLVRFLSLSQSHCRLSRLLLHRVEYSQKANSFFQSQKA